MPRFPFPKTVDDHALLPAYITALQRYTTHPVQLSLNVGNMTIVLAALQIALRYQGFPPPLRDAVAAFVQHGIARLTALDPTLGIVAHLGHHGGLEEPLTHAALSSHHTVEDLLVFFDQAQRHCGGDIPVWLDQVDAEGAVTPVPLVEVSLEDLPNGQTVLHLGGPQGRSPP